MVSSKATGSKSAMSTMVPLPSWRIVVQMACWMPLPSFSSRDFVMSHVW